MQRVSTTQPRHSARIEKNESHRVLDDAARIRRLKRQLACLEQDNSQEDPHANLVWHKSIPKFEDVDVGGPTKNRKSAGADSKKRKRFTAEHSKQRFRKNFAMLLEEHMVANKENPAISEAFNNSIAPPSALPQRHFCAACGFPSKYTCLRCGARYCCIRCRDVHNDTRCMKWTS